MNSTDNQNSVAVSAENGYLSLIFQNTSDLFCLLEVRKNNDHIIVSVNPSYLKAAKSFNPDITLETFVGRRLSEVMYEAYDFSDQLAREVLKEYEVTMKTGKPNTFTEEITFNGVVHYYSSNISPIRDENNKCTHLLYSSKDITDKKHYELDLRSREKKFRALIESSHECIALFNSNGDITYVSPTIKSIAGYEEDNFQGKPRLNFVHPDDRNNNSLMFQEVISRAGARVKFRFRLRHANGQFLWIEATLTNLLETPEVRGVVSNFRDITKQKLAEDQVKESNQLLENINQNINEGLFRRVPGAAFKYVNQALLQMFGFKDVEELNQVSSPTSLYACNTKQKEIYDTLISGETVNNAEVKFKRKDGTEFWGLLSSSLITRDNGEKFFDGAIRDITQIKLAEKKLRQLNDELKKQNIALASREEELNVALQELSDRNFELDQLVYKTSHDLRSPLTSILGLVNVAKVDTAPENQADYLSRIEKSILKLDEFVKSMLNYAKSSRTEIVIKPLELRELITSCVHDLEYLESFKKVKTNLDIKGRAKSFSSDPLRLKIIFSNIISNAYKYVNPWVEDSFLDINAVFESKLLVITFTDNGIGIHEKQIDKIFDMFYRATEKSEGSGLGMYIVKQSVVKLGGSIAVESTVNQGTTFTVKIPIQ